MSTKAKVLPLRPLPEGLQQELEHLIGTIYGRKEAADKLRTIIEQVLFMSTEPLEVATLEALRVPWDLMRALEREE